MKEYKINKKKIIKNYIIIAIFGQVIFLLGYSRGFAIERIVVFIVINIVFIATLIFNAVKQLKDELYIADNDIIYKEFRIVESIDINIPITQVHTIKRHKYNDISSIFMNGIEIKSRYKSVIIPISLFNNYDNFIETIVNITKLNKRIKIGKDVFDLMNKKDKK